MIRKLAQAEYQNDICDDIAPILLHLTEAYGLRIEEVILDIKAVSVEIYLDGQIPAEAIALMQKNYAANSKLRFDEKWVACLEHYCSVESAQTDNAREVDSNRRSFWSGLKQLFTR